LAARWPHPPSILLLDETSARSAPLSGVELQEMTANVLRQCGQPN